MLNDPDERPACRLPICWPRTVTVTLLACSVSVQMAHLDVAAILGDGRSYSGGSCISVHEKPPTFEGSTGTYSVTVIRAEVPVEASGPTVTTASPGSILRVMVRS